MMGPFGGAAVTLEAYARAARRANAAGLAG